MKSPGISVVVPLYNKEATIVRCLESVLAQSYSDFEILVIDDGSTDNGPDQVLALADPRIHVHRQANAGLSSARNTGLRMARGEFVAFIDADDEWQPRHLEFLLEGFEYFPDALLVGNDLVEARGGEPEEGRRGFELPEADASRDGVDYHLLRDYLWTLANGYFIFSGSSVMLRARGVREAGLWFLGSAEPAEDVNYWLRLSRVGSMVYCRYLGAIYHRDDANSIMNRVVNRALPVPPFLEEVDVSAFSARELGHLRRFLRREYLKKAYQNRGKPFSSREWRIPGEAVSPGWSARLAYAFIRFLPGWIFRPAMALRRSLRQ